MSKNQSKKQKDQSNSNKTTSNENEKQDLLSSIASVKEDLDNYIKLNEPLVKMKEEEERRLKELKEEDNIRRKELVKLKEENNSMKILDFSEKLLNLHYETAMKSLTFELKSSNFDGIAKEISLYKAKLDDKERFNKLLIDKIKIAQEEKKMIIDEDNKYRQDIQKKYDDFVKDIQLTIDKENENRELIIKENTDLKDKLRQAYEQLQEGFKSQEERLQSGMMAFNLNKEMEGKLIEINEKAKEYMKENIELRQQIELYNGKFSEVSKTIEQYNKAYDVLKKEVDKRNIENAYLIKKNEEMSVFEKEVVLLKSDLEKKEKQMSSMVNLNRTLSDQLKNLKEKEKEKS